MVPQRHGFSTLRADRSSAGSKSRSKSPPLHLSTSRWLFNSPRRPKSLRPGMNPRLWLPSPSNWLNQRPSLLPQRQRATLRSLRPILARPKQCRLHRLPRKCRAGKASRQFLKSLRRSRRRRRWQSHRKGSNPVRRACHAWPSLRPVPAPRRTIDQSRPRPPIAGHHGNGPRLDRAKSKRSERQPQLGVKRHLRGGARPGRNRPRPARAQLRNGRLPNVPPLRPRPIPARRPTTWPGSLRVFWRESIFPLVPRPDRWSSISASDRPENFSPTASPEARARQYSTRLPFT